MAEKNTSRKSHLPVRSDSSELALPNGGLTDIFEEMMEPFFGTPTRSLWSELGRWQPTLELQDRGDHFSLMAQLPGFSKDDVEVRINSGSLELKAEKKAESKSKTGERERVQSSYSFFHRFITLPDDVVASKADGTMKNGVLELTLPKRQVKPKDSLRRVDLK